MYRPTHEGGIERSDTANSGIVVLDGAIEAIPEASTRAHEPTLTGLHLFLHAAFGSREPSLLGDEQRDVAAHFGIGAISQATALSRLPDRTTRSTSRALLRWSFGVGHLGAWRWERALRKQASTREARRARHEGCSSLLAWLQGEDPARRLARLLDRRAAPAPRPAPARPASVQPLAQHRH